MGRKVWIKIGNDDWERIPYVARCSKCGRYHRSMLYEHWFFTGIYCIACIQDVLYDNARTIGEINK